MSTEVGSNVSIEGNSLVNAINKIKTYSGRFDGCDRAFVETGESCQRGNATSATTEHHQVVRLRVMDSGQLSGEDIASHGHSSRDPTRSIAKHHVDVYVVLSLVLLSLALSVVAAEGRLRKGR